MIYTFGATPNARESLRQASRLSLQKAEADFRTPKPCGNLKVACESMAFSANLVAAGRATPLRLRVNSSSGFNAKARSRKDLGKGFVYGCGLGYNALVRKLAWISLIFGVIIAVLAGFIWAIPREPKYHGKRLREWIRESQNGGEGAAEIRAYGTNAIPFYLKLLRTDSETGLKDKILDFLEEHKWPLFGLSREQITDEDIGCIGLCLLGPEARTAIPALTNLLSARYVRWLVGASLAATGLEGAKALKNMLQAPSPRLRATAAFFAKEYAHPRESSTDPNTGLFICSRTPGEVESAAQVLIPALISGANDSDQDARIASIDALGEFARDPEKIVPGLTGIAQNSKNDQPTRIAAITALGRYGSNARSSVASLLTDFNDPDHEVSRAAGLALMRIDDTAAAIVVARYSESIQTESNEVPSREDEILDLGRYGTKARAAVPALLVLIRKGNDELRRAATNALVAIDVEAAAQAGLDLSDVISGVGHFEPLANEWHPSLADQLAAVRALGKFGSRAGGSVPPLLWALKYDDPEMRREAGIALKKIAPEEAAKAGVE